MSSTEQFICALLWDEHPECCGRGVVGAEYMGQQEIICCGEPEQALLNDAQIVATLRARFPKAAAPLTYPQARAAFEAWANKAHYDPTDGELRDAFLAGIEFIEGPEPEAA